MDSLRFSKEFRYRYLETIYENTSRTASFFKAFDEVERRKVGIKRTKISPRLLSQARKEVLIINEFSTLTTNIPALYTTYYDQNNHYFYIIMQYLENGLTLRQYLDSPAYSSEHYRWMDIMIRLCDILGPIHKHRNRYQHRDLKPENILIKGREVYLIDFGLTAVRPVKGEGTMMYKAPEQNEYIAGIGNDNVDIFSLGVIMYEMLTGQAPVFSIDYACDPGSKTWDYYSEPNSKNPNIPQKINNIIIKCMALHPRERYQDAFDLKNALIKAKRDSKNEQ